MKSSEYSGGQMKKHSFFQNINRRKSLFGAIIFLAFLSAGLSSCGDGSKKEAKEEGYYTCSMHPQVILHEPGECPVCGMDLIFQSTSSQDEVHEGHDHGHGVDEKEEKTGMPAGEKMYVCPMHPEVSSPEPGKCPVCKMDLIEKKVPQEKTDEHDAHKGHDRESMAPQGETLYVCPMHPEVSSSQPGKCSICGMDLVARELPRGKAGKGTFRFTVGQNILVNSNFLTAPVLKEKFIRRARYSGHVDYNEDPGRLVVINTKYEGWVEKLLVSKEGQTIKKGQLLMGVYSPAILAAKEEYLTTYTTIKQMYLAQGKTLDELSKDPTLSAARRKLTYLDVSSSQVKKIETSGEAGRLTWYGAPIGGVVVKKSVLQGVHIKPGQELFRIANLNRLWAFIHIFEKDLAFIKKGQKVRLISAAYPDLKIEGRVDLIYPYIEQGSRDIKVRIVIPNSGLKLRPGMFIEVDLSTRFPGESLVIPDSAVIYSGEKSYVFVSLGRGVFELRPVKVKLTSDARSVISSGLTEKELVVVNGQFLLDSEASLKEAISKGEAATHQH